MAKRLMAVVTSSDSDGPYRGQAKVYRDTEWNEWVVRYYHGEEYLTYLGNGDSHHDDQADAMGTAEVVVKALAKQAVPNTVRRDNPDKYGVLQEGQLPPATPLTHRVVNRKNQTVYTGTKSGCQAYVIDEDTGRPDPRLTVLPNK